MSKQATLTVKREDLESMLRTVAVVQKRLDDARVTLTVLESMLHDEVNGMLDDIAVLIAQIEKDM